MFSTAKAVRGIQGRLPLGSAGIARRAGSRRALEQSPRRQATRSLSLVPAVAAPAVRTGSLSSNHQRRAYAAFSTAGRAGQGEHTTDLDVPPRRPHAASSGFLVRRKVSTLNFDIWSGYYRRIGETPPSPVLLAVCWRLVTSSWGGRHAFSPPLARSLFPIFAADSVRTDTVFYTRTPCTVQRQCSALNDIHLVLHGSSSSSRQGERGADYGGRCSRQVPGLRREGRCQRSSGALCLHSLRGGSVADPPSTTAAGVAVRERHGQGGERPADERCRLSGVRRSRCLHNCEIHSVYVSHTSSLAASISSASFFQQLRIPGTWYSFCATDASASTWRF